MGMFSFLSVSPDFQMLWLYNPCKEVHSSRSSGLLVGLRDTYFYRACLSCISFHLHSVSVDILVYLHLLSSFGRSPRLWKFLWTLGCWHSEVPFSSESLPASLVLLRSFASHQLRYVPWLCFPLESVTQYIYLIYIYLFGCTRSYLQYAGSSVFAVCGSFSYSQWDLVPWAGIKSRSPALGTWSLNHWTTREVPKTFIWEADFIEKCRLKIFLFIIHLKNCCTITTLIPLWLTSVEEDKSRFLTTSAINSEKAGFFTSQDKRF